MPRPAPPRTAAATTPRTTGAAASRAASSKTAVRGAIAFNREVKDQLHKRMQQRQGRQQRGANAAEQQLGATASAADPQRAAAEDGLWQRNHQLQQDLAAMQMELARALQGECEARRSAEESSGVLRQMESECGHLRRQAAEASAAELRAQRSADVSREACEQLRRRGASPPGSPRGTPSCATDLQRRCDELQGEVARMAEAELAMRRSMVEEAQEGHRMQRGLDDFLVPGATDMNAASGDPRAVEVGSHSEPSQQLRETAEELRFQREELSGAQLLVGDILRLASRSREAEQQLARGRDEALREALAARAAGRDREHEEALSWDRQLRHLKEQLRSEAEDNRDLEREAAQASEASLLLRRHNEELRRESQQLQRQLEDAVAARPARGEAGAHGAEDGARAVQLECRCRELQAQVDSLEGRTAAHASAQEGPEWAGTDDGCRHWQRERLPSWAKMAGAGLNLDEEEEDDGYFTSDELSQWQEEEHRWSRRGSAACPSAGYDHVRRMTCEARDVVCDFLFI